ncbi:MAG: HlyD family secretion protein, partial [Bacteroidetes bacterium]
MKIINTETMFRFSKILGLAAVAVLVISCGKNDDRADAYGNFEVEETTISAQASGELLQFDIEEGTLLKSNQLIGVIDSTTLVIQKNEIMANIASVKVNKTSVAAEQSVLNSEMTNLKRELKRVKKLVKSEAATQKQLDDLEGNIVVLKSKMAATNSKYAVIDAQVDALYAKIELINEQINRCLITNPSPGLVLTKLARANELMAPGRPLYKIANMSKIYLKAYISEPQLATIKEGQKVTISIDYQDGLKDFEGTITWVSSESEFTPKIIQT